MLLFSHWVMSNSLPHHGLQHTRLLLFVFWSLLTFMSIELVMLSNHLIFWHPLLLLPSIFPNIRVFSSQFYASGGQSIGASASASVLPMNIQAWCPLGLTCLISLQSKGLSSLLQHHNSKASIRWHSTFLYGPTLMSVPDYWKNHSFDNMDLCQQNHASTF